MKHVVYDCDNTLGVLFSDVDDGLALLNLLGDPPFGGSCFVYGVYLMNLSMMP